MVVPVSTSVSAPFIKAMQTRAQSPFAALAKTDPERAHMLQDVHARLGQALSTARSSKTNIKEQAKAAAREKITRIKEQIKNLRMLAAGADPKSIAQQAARLAKELAAAVKDYASAGGTDVITSSAVMPTNNAPATDSVQADVNPDAVTDDPEAFSDLDLTFAGSKDEAVLIDEGVVDDSGQLQEKDLNDNPFATDKTEQDRQNFALPAGNQEDREFATEVKKMIDELKTLLRMQRARLKDTDKDAQDDIKDGEKALEDATKSVQAIMAQASVPVLNIQA